MALANRVFEAFPEPFREALSEDSSFLSHIGRTVVSSLTFGRWQVEADAFALAASELLASDNPAERRELSALSGSEPEMLWVSRDDDITFTVVSTKLDQTLRARDTIFGILNPNEEKRRAACDHLRVDADVGLEEWVDIADNLVRTEDPAQRFRAAVEWRQRAVKVRYTELRSRWKRTAQIRATDLCAAPPVDVLRHLRLDPSAMKAKLLDEAWNAAATLLIEEVGLEDAFERMSGVPIPLPPAAHLAFQVLDETARNALVRKRLRTPTSPLGIVHFLQALAGLGDVSPSYPRLARRIAQHFTNADARVNLSMMRSVAAEALSALRADRRGNEVDNDKTSRNDDDPALLIAAWYHAHQFVSSVHATHGNAEHLETWLASHAAWTTADLFRSPEPAADVADPSLFSTPRFVVATLQRLSESPGLRSAITELVQAYRSTIMHVTGEHSIPHLDLFRDLRYHPNALSSFLQPRRSEDGAIRVGETEIVSSSASPDSMIADALAALEKDIADPSGWIALNAVSGAEALNPLAGERVRRIAVTSDLASLLSSLGEVAASAVQRLAREVLGEENGADRTLIREALIGAGVELAMTEVPSETQKRAKARAYQAYEGKLSESQIAVVEGLHTLAQGESTPAEAMAAFAKDLTRISQKSAAYLQAIRPTLERLVQSRPLIEAEACVSLLLDARAS